ncbi:MAG: hypothetical protein H7Y60_09670 [Rhodospirillaceae bacterium]|nr:hypothetical protein [Rhodospirillales bacterium]
MTMSNVAAAKALIDSQAAKGLGKYGMPLEHSDATVSQLARHGAEEMADALAYFVELERRAKVLEDENELLRAAIRWAAPADPAESGTTHPMTWPGAEQHAEALQSAWSAIKTTPDTAGN